MTASTQKARGHVKSIISPPWPKIFHKESENDTVLRNEQDTSVSRDRAKDKKKT